MSPHGVFVIGEIVDSSGYMSVDARSLREYILGIQRLEL